MPIRRVLAFAVLILPLQAQDPGLERQVAELRDLVVKLQARVDQLEKRDTVVVKAVEMPSATPVVTGNQPPVPASAPGLLPTSLAGTTLNFGFDGYYGYNFNNPIGRVNLLRAYDVSSNAISLNQASIILENAADPDAGKRWGARLDLQFGQATATLQGNSNNEPRPDIYRSIFQAYGTYVFPIAKGLTVDFGKFASSLGIEGNYSKDQINYSRSLWFNFLPFYHTGVRTSLKINDFVALNHWIVNGTQQTEPFNGYKDEFFGITYTPTKNLTWNVNYYLGEEHPDVIYYPNGGAPPNSPTLQGIPFQPIPNSLHGKLHIFDSYVSWNVNPKLTLAADLDYVIQRDSTTSPPQHTDGGTGYLRYQFTPKIALGLRSELMSDRGALFSGTSQTIKEETVTFEYKVSENFLFRNEWRTDFSNQRYFYTNTLGILKKQQNTATVGLVWWFGGKQGAW